ncbi:RNA polymerase sigma factor [Micromonospora sp. NPDC050397]|uniref:RNA polymerase sigma factor n=1 Tax=Micromonospora sp. NPDC050397 TaxID=3364279 RepID=UPI00384F9511
MTEKPVRAGATDPAPNDGAGAENAEVDAAGRQGFNSFYEGSYRRLTAQIHAYLGDRAEAEDIVQEAFVRAWQRWPTVCRYDDPSTWVRRVAWNLATSRLRRLTVAARILRRQPPPALSPPPNPDHVALVAALRRLPDRQRRAVVLHYLADLPVLTVAEELGVPKGTVTSLLYRGRNQLAAYLTEAEATSVPAAQPHHDLPRR